MNQQSLLLVLLILITACTGKTDVAINEPAIKLRSQLKALGTDYIIFGHQDVFSFGENCDTDPYRSDVKDLAGQYPAMFGWELGHIGEQNNIDNVPFDSIRSYVKYVNSLGGINTFSWHAKNPISGYDAWILNNPDVESMLPNGKNHQLLINKLDFIAEFLGSLKTTDNNPIPLIFRPWHDMNADWFWWGTSTCSNEEFISLFRFTVNYLRDEKGLKNLLIAYSPNVGQNFEQEYLTRYPGDDVVDILGLNDYNDFITNRLDLIVQRISFIVNLANKKNKISAFTETGNNQLKINNWFTTNLLPVLKANEKCRSLAYVMVWKNKNFDIFNVPYKGHEQSTDFKVFVNDKMILLLDDYKKVTDNNNQ